MKKQLVADMLHTNFATGLWFLPGTPVYSTNKTDSHDITEILLKMALNTINQPPNCTKFFILSIKLLEMVI